MEGKVVHNEQEVAKQRNLVKPYPNPPLMEALCEFRFAGGSPWDGTVPGLVYEQLRDQFPKRKQVRAIEVHEKGTEQVVRPSERVHLLQEDERAVVQVGANVLVVNCLRPYPSWRRFSQLIGRAFNAYREAAQPGELATIGLRYINHIELPTGEADLGRYFEFRPFLGPRLPQSIDSFLVSVTVPYEEGRDRLRVELASVSASRKGAIAFRLDLHYFLARGGAVPLDDALDWAETAHDRIEETFEGAITDDLRRTFFQRSA
ncbi:MAG TPA: TIGR04255 family protein [Candidatus Bipolaricaulis sp.]|nr:TIGR04255 family protein [Candidatus Bipolaricaulis sp.]HPD07561.1 TIGR04255 family protein [Candidatus Bipolaricaulis sp.]